MKGRIFLQYQKSINIFQTQPRHMVLREKVLEAAEKSRIFKGVRTIRATPKPWVAGSNPPAPAKTEVKRLRFFSFWCLLFCISLSKAEMTKFFNAFRSKSPSSLSNNSNCSNRSVCHSIKKAATVSTELQKSVRATANSYCCGSPFIFDYSDANFDSLYL